MASISYNDDSVVVIIGSGAGGGTLANELCQKGIKVVVLEAGARQSPQSFVNDEWKSFGQLAWLDPRTTSGLACCQGFLWLTCLDLQDRGRINHPLGWRIFAFSRARVPSQNCVWRYQGRQLARLAHHVVRTGALLCQSRKQNGRDSY